MRARRWPTCRKWGQAPFPGSDTGNGACPIFGVRRVERFAQRFLAEHLTCSPNPGSRAPVELAPGAKPLAPSRISRTLAASVEGMNGFWMNAPALAASAPLRSSLSVYPDMNSTFRPGRDARSSSADLGAAHAGHHHVDQHEVNRAGLGGAHPQGVVRSARAAARGSPAARALPRPGGGRRPGPRPRGSSRALPRSRPADGGRRGLRRLRARRAGGRPRTSRPCPGSLTTRMSPPLCRTMP